MVVDGDGGTPCLPVTEMPAKPGLNFGFWVKSEFYPTKSDQIQVKKVRMTMRTRMRTRMSLVKHSQSWSRFEIELRGQR